MNNSESGVAASKGTRPVCYLEEVFSVSSDSLGVISSWSEQYCYRHGYIKGRAKDLWADGYLSAEWIDPR